MILELDRLSVGADPGAPLPPVSAVAAPGRIGVVAVETEATPTVASLVAGGRMAPDAGRLLADGVEDAARVRAHTALVDTPGVAEPFPVMTVARIVREELALAGHRASRSAVTTVVDELGLAPFADTAVERVPTALRMRLLTELALLRPEVEALVVTSPERHGGAVVEWFEVLQAIADRGIAVLVVTSRAAAETIAALVADRDGATDPPAPVSTTLVADRDEPTGPHHVPAHHVPAPHMPAHRLPEPDVPTEAEPRLQTVSPASQTPPTPIASDPEQETQHS